MSNDGYREDLPEIPDRIRKLPVLRGYPVPWFVQEFEHGYDFRVVGGEKMLAAIHQKLCWICGEPLGSIWVFTIGPMCIINRITSEPPSHRECAVFAVKACPFLNQREIKRNEKDLPENTQGAAGIHIDRQPGVIALWFTNNYNLTPAPGGTGFLFEIGDPSRVLWFRESREATRDEILESIESGFPELEKEEQPNTMGMAYLHERKTGAMKYLPDNEKKRMLFGSAARSRS
jgi:hypothetical protein